MELDPGLGVMKEVLEGLAALLEENKAEEALVSCRFLLDMLAMFEGPFEINEAAFMAGVFGLPVGSSLQAEETKP